MVKDETPLPSWLSFPDPKTRRPSKDAVELKHQIFEQLFESVIENIYRGRSLKSLLEEDARDIPYEAFLRWVHNDPKRHARFREAQEMRTDFIAGEILDIADGLDSIDPAASDTVNRDKLRIETRKWLMAAHNRKRYGETKQIEVGGSISITDALTQARDRLIGMDVIEGELVNNDPTPENDAWVLSC